MTTATTKLQMKAGTGKVVIDPAHDLLRVEGHPLDPIFSPKNVAVIGATERQGSVGRTVLWNLLSSPFGGTVYPINTNRPSVLGIRAYRDIRTLPEKPDLIVVTTPAPTVPALIQEAVELGVPAGIVISAGFQGARRSRPRTGAADRGDHPGEDAYHRPQLLGSDESHWRPERHFRQRHGAAGQRGFHQPERSALHRGAGLEFA